MLIPAITSVVFLASSVPSLKAPPRAEPPKVDLNLPGVPKAEGLSEPSRPATLESKQSAGDLRSSLEPAGRSRASISSVLHAKDFSATAKGHTPVGRIDALTSAAFPAQFGTFKTCMTVVSTDGLPVVLKASLRSPSGTEILASRADVHFDSGGGRRDVVIEWESFQAAQAGPYVIAVTLDGRAAGELPLPIRAK